MLRLIFPELRELNSQEIDDLVQIGVPAAAYKCRRVEAKFIMSGSSTNDGGRPESTEIVIEQGGR